MCPDRQLLSVYFDGELPSPWKEKMENHIAVCPSCREHLELYRRLSVGPAPDEEEAIKAARDRVWQKMELPASPVRATPRAVRFGSLWQRSISIPIPAAAAIAVLFIALALMWVTRTTNTKEPVGMILASETDFETPGFIPVSNMDDVLQYLGNRDGGEVVIIRLPESRNFVNYGEPAIIRAADYSRSIPGRRRP